MKKISIILIIVIMLSFTSCKYEPIQNEKLYYDKAAESIEKQSEIAQVGDIIKFGHWEQDGNYENGEEEIEWIVLEVSNNKYLVLSKYALDGDIYSFDRGFLAFYDGSIANFMEDFFYDAFNYLEEKKIVSGTITSSNGNYTPKDKVFALSLEELNKYSKDIPDIYDCYPIEAIKDDLSIIEIGKDIGKCYWWVREDNSYSGEVVTPNGRLNIITDIPCCGFRPAIWLDFNYKIQISNDIKIDSELLGKWYVSEGGDKHTITILNNNEILFDDEEEELLKYICYSPTEIAVGEEFVFVLKDDEIIRYNEYDREDTYVYRKQ